MKRKLPKWSGSAAALVLLAGALGVLAWQGSRQLTTASGNAPARLAAVTETVTETSMLPAEESQPRQQTVAAAQQTAAPVTSVSSTPETAVSFPLNLNTAGAAELEQLPGIGAVLAQRIVAYRTQIGSFSNREQLLEVDGIGAAKLEKLNGWIFVENETALSAEPEQPPQEETVPPQPAEESALPETPAETTPLMPLPLDLNRAGEEDLMQLPDMQPALAAEIVAFRERITAFSSVYELLYVDGMTETYFTKIQDSVQIYGDIAPE